MKVPTYLGNVTPYARLCRSGIQTDGIKNTGWTLRQVLMQHSQTSVLGGHAYEHKSPDTMASVIELMDVLRRNEFFINLS